MLGKLAVKTKSHTVVSTLFEATWGDVLILDGLSFSILFEEDDMSNLVISDPDILKISLNGLKLYDIELGIKPTLNKLIEQVGTIVFK